MRIWLGFGLLLLLSDVAMAADHSQRWYFMWGYNRALYQNSDIHFKGDGYDFTLLDVKGDDLPSSFDWKYLFPDVTIPQTVSKIGYYLNKNHRISFGVDHMKYRVRVDQSVKKTGVDYLGGSGDGSAATEQLLSTSYLKYEHTDGLNYVNLGIDSLNSVWHSGSLEFSTFYGLDVGFVLPRSNVTLGANNARYDKFNLAGYGAAVSVGVVLDLGKNWFVQFAAKQGVLVMDDIRTTSSPADSASQNIVFLQSYLAAAYLF